MGLCFCFWRRGVGQGPVDSHADFSISGVGTEIRMGSSIIHVSHPEREEW